MAEGLAAAHARGLIHRDIKPANIWLEGDAAAERLDGQVRRCKLLDFGLARPADGGDAQLTAHGEILGTPAYMAPEQAKGERVDRRADLFALGVTLYRMAAGQMPFRGANLTAVLVALTTEAATPVRQLAPHLPREVARLIERLMSKDPAGRPRSAAEVVSLVRRASGEAPPGTAPAHASPAARNGRPRLVIAATVVILLALSGGLWLAGRTGGGAGGAKAPEGVRGDIPGGAEQAAADEAAVRYALAGGATVLIDGAEREVRTPAQVPMSPFRLTGVRNFSQPIDDSGLAVFRGCRHLSLLDLSCTEVSDAGLSHFEGCAQLLRLELRGLRVGDEGVSHFRQCRNLTHLELQNTRVTDSGLACFRDCRQLTYLDLGGTRVGDAGLADLGGSSQLRELHINGTRVSDKSLGTIKRFVNLAYLYAPRTRLTSEGIAALADALPRCEIRWDGGTILARRRAAPLIRVQ